MGASGAIVLLITGGTKRRFRSKRSLKVGERGADLGLRYFGATPSLDIKDRAPTYKFSMRKACLINICLSIIMDAFFKCASGLALDSSEFKHTGRLSVSLSSLPVCLHKLQIKQRFRQVSIVSEDQLFMSAFIVGIKT